MTRSTAPQALWDDLRRAARDALQAELDYERVGGSAGESELDSAFSRYHAAVTARSQAIRAIVQAEQKEPPL